MGVKRGKFLPDSDRVSIWSIARPWGTIYYVLFSLQITGVICLVGWREIFINTDDTAVDTILAIGAGAAPNILTAAAVSLVIVLLAEVTRMLAEPYLQKRFRAGREEGIKEGRAEERARRHNYVSMLRAWNERRIEAADKGEPFDEPMPELDDEGDESA